MSQATRPLSRGAYKALLTACIVVAAGAAVVGAKAWLSPPPGATTPSAVQAPDAPRGDPAGEGTEAELVTILPTGFEPAEITRARGKFLLVVNNQSGLEQVTWRLEREAGGRLHEVRLSDGRLRSGQYEDLPPGTYLLTESGHPDRTCRIRITP